MMIERDISPVLLSLFGQYPFVTVTGPRQSGKTTLCRAAFPSLKYVNLELADERDFAESDPRRFLDHVGQGAILDEIQRVPSLLSYLQVMADEANESGLFVLTGSENFKLSGGISQSLAGRTALLRLLPFSLAERLRANPDGSVDDLLYAGFYPRIHDRGLEPSQAYADYFETYVERDVRRLGGVRNLSSFRRFVRLCAGRIGQLAQLSALGEDAGVTHRTAREWLTLLERSFIVFQSSPYHGNLRKRLVKTPKLYFHDVGLACHLLGVEAAGQIATHPLRGPLFENMVISEAVKHRLNRGRSAELSFFRDSRGLECDLLYPLGNDFVAVEVKSAATVASDFFGALNSVAELVPGVTHRVVVYGGERRESRSAGEVVPCIGFEAFLGRLEAEKRLAATANELRTTRPASSETEALAGVFRNQIDPILTALQPPLTEGLAPLFSEMQSVSFAGRTNRMSSFSKPASWRQAWQTKIAGHGLPSTGEDPLELRHEFRLDEYCGRGGEASWNLHIVISWKLGAESAHREVRLDGAPLNALEWSATYAEAARPVSDADRVVADIVAAAEEAVRHSRG